MADWDDMVLVGKVARPHGIRGQVIVNPETDFIDDRFRVGATLWIRDGQMAPLTVTSFRVQGGRPVVGFDGFERIEDVERLAGHELRVPEDTLRPLEPGRYYHHQLVGCEVETASGEPVGVVERVEGGTGGSRLVITGTHGEVLIPLATAICVDIDVAAKRIRINPPDGLLDLNEVRHRHDLSADGRGRPRGRRHQPGP
jgi:16S rRNA processing protein RimM